MNFKKHIDMKLVVSGLIIFFGAAVFFCAFNNLDAIRSFIGKALRILSPVTGGIMVAYLIRPFARFLEKKVFCRLKTEKARVHFSSLTTVFLFLVLIIFVIANVIPQLLSGITNLATNFDSYLASARTLIADYASRITVVDVDVDKFLVSSNEILSSVGKWLSSNVSTFVSFFYTLSSQIFNFIIVIAMAIYALLDRKNIKKGLIKLENVTLGKSAAQRVNEILHRGDILTTKFLASNVLDAAIIGVVNFIFLTIFKAPYTPLLSVLLGVFNFVPTFGPIAGGIIASIVVLLTKPTLLLGFIIFTIVLQQLDGNVIKPLLFGDSTGLSPFWVLVAIVVGGRLFGVLGMILGVPVLALLFSIYHEIIDKREKQLQAQAEEKERSSASGEKS